MESFLIEPIGLFKICVQVTSFLKSNTQTLTMRTQHISHDSIGKTAHWNSNEMCSYAFYRGQFQQF